MQFLRRPLRPGVVGDERRVARVACGKRPQARFRPRPGQQLVREEIAVAPQARQDLLRDGGADPVARTAALVLRQPGKVVFVRQQERDRDSGLEQVVDRGDDALDVHPGRGAILEQPAAQVCDELIEIAARLRVPRSEIGCALRRLQRIVLGGLRQGDLRAIHLVDDPQRRRAGLRGPRIGERLAQHLDGDLLVGRQPGGGNGGELGPQLRERVDQLAVRVG